MEEKILITKENYKDIFNSLTYGYKVITYDSEDVRIAFNKRIEIMNIITGFFTVEEKQHIIDHIENGEIVSIKPANVYQVLYKNYREPIMQIPEDNYRIEELAIISNTNKSITVIKDLHYNLVKYAKSIANKHQVKFTGSGFNGTIKSLSVKRQIEDAYLSGKYDISFSSSDFNAQTIRNHASIYGSLIGKKIKVEFSKGLITVIFKNLDEINSLFFQIKDSYQRLLEISEPKEINLFFNKLFNHNQEEKTIGESFVKTALEKVIPEQLADSPYKLYGKSVTKSEYAAAEIWQRQGYASEYNMEHGIEGKEDKTPVVIDSINDSVNEYENDSINEYENDSNDNYNSDSDYGSENENEYFEDEDDDF